MKSPAFLSKFYTPCLKIGFTRKSSRPFLKAFYLHYLVWFEVSIQMKGLYMVVFCSYYSARKDLISLLASKPSQKGK